MFQMAPPHQGRALDTHPAQVLFEHDLTQGQFLNPPVKDPLLLLVQSIIERLVSFKERLVLEL